MTDPAAPPALSVGMPRDTGDGGCGSLVCATGVTKTYRGGGPVVEALRDVHLTIAHGEMLAVVGPSGNGKSTLINCLSGIDPIDRGRVLVEGIDVHGMSERARTAHRARTMGFVFQSFNLIPVLSAVENVELPLLAVGTDPDEARERAQRMLDRVALADRAAHRPGELSGGQQQRVAIARALVGSPRIVWADEPTGNLDSSIAGTIADLLVELHHAGPTVVVLTHDATLAGRADRIVEVRDGRVVDPGP